MSGTDRSLGENALRIFYKESKSLYGESFPYSFNEFLSVIDKRQKSFIGGLGLGISLTEISESRLNESMINLARLSKGGIPKENRIFTQALQDQLQAFDVEFFTEVTKATIIDTAEIVKKAGIGIAGTYLAWLSIPVLIFLFSIYKKKK